MMSGTRLALKVKAVNLARSTINELAPKAIAAMRQFVGKPVVTAKGELRANVRKALTEAIGETNTARLRVWVSAGNNYCIYINASATEFGDSESERSEHYANIADVRDGVMESTPVLFAPDRCDYTVEEVERLTEEFRKAREAADKAKNAIWLFKEWYD